MTLRVVHVIARLNVGGPAAIIQTVVAGAPDDVEHIVLSGTPGVGEAAWSTLRGGDLPVRYLSALTPEIKPAQEPRALAQIARALRAINPDVVHTHTAKGGLLGRVAARRVPRVRTVHTFHGHVLHGYFSPRVTKTYVAVERGLAKRTDRLISVGDRVGEELIAAGIGRREQFTSIPPGVNAPATVDRAVARRALDLPEDGHVIAMIGRLTEIKRVDRGLDVIRALRDRGIEATVLIAGGGDLEEALAVQARDLGHRVVFLGWVGDVGQVLSAADLVLLTSDNEGMPVGLIEAAHAGLPIVATDVGSVSEVVVHGVTGRVVPTAAQALADECAELLADPDLRARMSSAAIGHARRNFSASTVVDRHHQIYSEVTQ